jgi:chorismate synthase
MSSSIGSVFVVTTFGESHGAAIGAVIDGCPAGLPLTEADIQARLDRRRPGQSTLATARSEADRVRILAGVDGGVTLGSPIALAVSNTDVRPADYAALQEIPRPSHADFTYRRKYGVLPASGGGRSSARETVARVAAGAVAETLLRARWQVEIVAWVSAVGGVTAPDPDVLAITREAVDRHAVRCPDAAAAEAMEAEIRAAREDGDSVGGVVSAVCRGVPTGWGEPVFGKLTATLAAAMMSLPAARGFEVGLGFAAAAMRGSAHNDPFALRDGQLTVASNRSGGIQGGISNGAPIRFRVGFKPAPSIAKPQHTVDWAGRPAVLAIKGRHDPCVAPRAVPVVEAMAALVLADAALLDAARR